ncbi:MAG: hypothetical protein ABW166_11700 [Sedimenticola sp.]
MMHGLMGWLGLSYFLFTYEGMGMAVLVVCITQAVDQVRIRKEKWQEIEALPAKERNTAKQALTETINKMMAMTYIQNVILFSGVVLFTAHAARTYGWM